MKRLTLAAPLLAVAITLAACSNPPPHSAPPAKHAPTTTVIPAPAPNPTPAPPSTLTVPTDLIGKTMSDAKAELSKLGFTNIVVAGDHGGTITDTDKVISAPEAGKQLSPTAPVRLIARSPTPLPAPPNTNSSTASSSHGGVQYTCDLNSPIKTDPNNPNLIINRACGYTGSDGKQHSHDPWIEGQLQLTRCVKSDGHWDIPSQSCKHN